MTLPGSRAMRLIHLALTLGVTLAGSVFVVVRRVAPFPPLPQGRTIAIALAGAAIGILVVALTQLRPRIPEQAPQQSGDDYWGDARVRTAALTLWAAVEGASLIGAVGYLLTGAAAPAAALVLGILGLVSVRPARFERDLTTDS